MCDVATAPASFTSPPPPPSPPTTAPHHHHQPPPPPITTHHHPPHTTTTPSPGLAVYLHADRWKNALPSTVRVTALPDSGFFLETDTAQDGDGPRVAEPPFGQYAAGMKAMVLMSNATAGLSPACLAGRAVTDQWRCIFAQESAKHLATPTFALQSAYDTWQLANEMAPGAEKDAAAVNAYGSRVRHALAATLLADSRHGAFIESCAHHCFAWGEIRADGAVQADAFAAWWRSHGRSKSVWNQTVPYPCTACCHGGG